MQLRFDSGRDYGYKHIVGPGEAGLDDVGLDMLRLRPGQSHSGAADGRELALVILGGRCDARCGRSDWRGIGERPSVFGGHATCVYIPSGSQYGVAALSELEIAVVYSPTEGRGFEPRVVAPAEVKARAIGGEGFSRSVEDIIDREFPAARLIVGETFNRPGQWSSYPPHKHDVHNPPLEVELEEVYLFKLEPPQGFGLQRLYTADGARDEALVIRDGDVVALPNGYHPVAAAPGYSLYYLWALAGRGRAMAPNDDPAHTWVKGV
jgi:5-deoxy-glucuronate isomerase